MAPRWVSRAFAVALATLLTAGITYLASKHRAPRRSVDREGREVSLPNKDVLPFRWAIMPFAIIFAIMSLVFLSKGDVLGAAGFTAMTLGCIFVFWLPTRTMSDEVAYHEDEDHFETKTRILHRPVNIRFDDIELIETSWNQGYIWVRSRDGQRMELHLSRLGMPLLCDHILSRWNDGERFHKGFFAKHAAPLYSVIMNPRTNPLTDDFVRRYL